jgi:hypothetical protein
VAQVHETPMHSLEGHVHARNLIDEHGDLTLGGGGALRDVVGQIAESLEDI